MTSPPLHPTAYTHDTLASLLRDRRDKFADRIAFSQKREGEWLSVTWREYAEDIARLSKSLRDHGLERGDYVAIMGDVSQEWIIDLP